MMKKYKGALGEFHYDPKMYEIKKSGPQEFLHFKDSYVGPISLPVGLTNCSYLFYSCNINPKCTLLNFDTSLVKDMSHMFDGCHIPDNFSLEASEENNVLFNTTSVKSMKSMFENCNVPKNFTFGKMFNTINVENLSRMFFGATVPSTLLKYICIRNANVDLIFGGDCKTYGGVKPDLKDCSWYDKKTIYVGKDPEHKATGILKDDMVFFNIQTPPVDVIKTSDGKSIKYADLKLEAELV